MPDSKTEQIRKTEGGTVPCPLCHDFEGPPESVEGHISSKTDDLHSGVTGRDFRDDIRLSRDGDGPVSESMEAIEEGAGQPGFGIPVEVVYGILVVLVVLWLISDSNGSAESGESDEEDGGENQLDSGAITEAGLVSE